MPFPFNHYGKGIFFAIFFEKAIMLLTADLIDIHST